MMVDTWVMFLLGNALMLAGVYITYLLREIKLYQGDVEQLVAVMKAVAVEIKVEEDDETRH